MKVSKKVLSIIELSILQEIKARDFYRSIASQLPDKGASLKLSIMGDTEEEHRKILSNWYKRLTGHDPVIPESKKKEARRMVATPPRDALLKDVVKLIYEAEERAYQFYKEASEKAEDPDSKSVFQKLAQMEKSHEDFFRGEYQTLVEDTSIRFGDEEIPWMIEAME
ncbi:MAG: ferritin family protein, partial [Candidatus Brocadiales bacterium]